jgi:hypothetical protein
MAKFWIERCVCAPHRCPAGTSIGPKVSFSVRVVVFMGQNVAVFTVGGCRKAEVTSITGADEPDRA